MATILRQGVANCKQIAADIQSQRMLDMMQPGLRKIMDNRADLRCVHTLGERNSAQRSGRKERMQRPWDLMVTFCIPCRRT